MAKVKIGMIVLLIIIISTIVIVDYSINYRVLSDKQRIFDDANQLVLDYDDYSYSTKRGRNMNDTSSLEFEFSGMDTIWDIKAQSEGILHINFQSIIASGEFKVLLITPSDEIVTILEQSKSNEKDIQISEGISKIKIVGRDAKGELKMTLTANPWLDIIPINN